MDRLEAKEIAIAEIPTIAKELRLMGRVGELWRRLIAMPHGRALEVANRDDKHARRTIKDVRDKARSQRREVVAQRAGTTVYVYLKELSK